MKNNVDQVRGFSFPPLSWLPKSEYEKLPLIKGAWGELPTIVVRVRREFSRKYIHEYPLRWNPRFQSFDHIVCGIGDNGPVYGTGSLTYATDHTPEDVDYTYEMYINNNLSPFSSAFRKINESLQELCFYADKMNICSKCMKYTINKGEEKCQNIQKADLLEYISANATINEFEFMECGTVECIKAARKIELQYAKKHQNSDNKETRLAALKTINKIGSSKVSPKYATSRNAKYIYFLKSGSNIKIGITNNLRQRFENIGTYTPYPPTLENCITTDRASELENLLHTTLQKYNTHREWFLLPTSIESFVLELNSPEEVINFCEKFDSNELSVGDTEI
jgi:hypothetical protein